MRKPQGHAERGSQRWIQYFVNEKPVTLNKEIANQTGGGADIRWLSPLKEDEHAEYRDNQFLERLGVKCRKPLHDFWPRNGPQWDAFGRRSDGTVILLEAKSHSDELTSDMGAEDPSSIDKISEALRLTKEHYGVGAGFDWTKNYYQYANRIAFLYYLSELCKIPTILIFLYFANDYTVEAPLSVSEWSRKISEVKKQLGLSAKNIKNMAEIFIEVKK